MTGPATGSTAALWTWEHLDAAQFALRDNDACYCKLVMGMIDMPPVTASGRADYDFGCCKAPIANQRLYQRLPILLPDTIHDRDDPNLQKQHPMRNRVLFLLLCSDQK